MTTAYITPAQSEKLGGPLRRRLRWWGARTGQRLADLGVPAGALRHRYVSHVAAEAVSRSETIHPAHIHPAPLPLNVAHRNELSDDPGWWGFSMRDVPERRVDPVRILRPGAARVLSGRTDDAAADYFPAILDPAGRSLDLREIRYRSFHAPLFRRPPDLILDRAVWIAERVFDNHSHWLSAHLPKLVMLRDRGLLEDGDLVLPASRPARVDESLRALGIAPERAHHLPAGHVLDARDLTLVACDRFHPALLGAAREALAVPPADGPARILVSRRAAKGRQLLEEDAMAPMLARFGFIPVEMETLDFAAQVRLMAGADAVLAPHGAGLTNMLFCRPGTKIFEIADPDYPNPNFYAMAAALDLPYTLIAGRGAGTGHPLHRDLSVDPAGLGDVLEAWL